MRWSTDTAGCVVVRVGSKETFNECMQNRCIDWGSSQSMDIKSPNCSRRFLTHCWPCSWHDRFFSIDHRTSTKSAMTRIYLVASPKQWARAFWDSGLTRTMPWKMNFCGLTIDLATLKHQFRGYRIWLTEIWGLSVDEGFQSAVFWYRHGVTFVWLVTVGRSKPSTLAEMNITIANCFETDSYTDIWSLLMIIKNLTSLYKAFWTYYMNSRMIWIWSTVAARSIMSTLKVFLISPSFLWQPAGAFCFFARRQEQAIDAEIFAETPSAGSVLCLRMKGIQRTAKNKKDRRVSYHYVYLFWLFQHNLLIALTWSIFIIPTQLYNDFSWFLDLCFIDLWFSAQYMI